MRLILYAILILALLNSIGCSRLFSKRNNVTPNQSPNSQIDPKPQDVSSKEVPKIQSEVELPPSNTSIKLEVPHVNPDSVNVMPTSEVTIPDPETIPIKMPSSNKEQSDDNYSDTDLEDQYMPKITSISSKASKNGTITITLTGTGFNSNSIVEIYESNNKIVGKLTKKVASGERKLVITKKLGAGKKYYVKVKNGDHVSNTATLVTKKAAIEPQKRTPSLYKNMTKNPKTLYLGGGNALDIFNRYVNENSGVGSSCSRGIKIKFWENRNLNSISLNDMEQLFVESSDDFIDRLKKRLEGHTAEYMPSIVDVAVKEGADYLIFVP